MNSKEAQTLTNRIRSITGNAASIQQEVWTFQSGNKEIEYHLWIEGSVHISKRFPTWKELVSHVKENF